MTKKTLVALLLLTACAAGPEVAPITGGTEIALSRQLVLKGTRGAMTLDPMLARRDYVFTCTQGADATRRAEAALARVTELSGSVGSQALGMSMQEHEEIGKVQSVIRAEDNCVITRNTTSKVSTDLATVLKFVMDHNLMGELAQ